MPDHDDLARSLRALAQQQDRESRAVDADAAMERRAGGGRPSRRPLLAAAAGLVVVGAMGVGLLVGSGSDEGTGVTTDDPPAPTSTSTTPTTVQEVLYTGVDIDDLPTSGIVVSGEGGTELLAFDGTVLGRAPVDVGQALGGFPRQIVAVRYPTGALELADADATETPEGCEEADGAGGLRVAMCGPGGQFSTSLVAVRVDGSQELLVGEAPGTVDGVGHWRWAIPSPDGRWVLAQWSSECEVPIAHLVSADGRTVRPIVEGVNSKGVGWTEDGRMVVQFGPGHCGSGIEEPGIYLVDPDTGDRLLVRADREGHLSAGLWERRANENEPERILFRALRELGLEGCCGEPSHGGSGATAGAVWQGEDIAITASPTDTTPDLPDLSFGPGELAGAPVVFGEADGYPNDGFTRSPFVAFTCGGFTWHVGYGLQMEPASEAAVHSFAEALLPHLYCTVGPRPAP